METDLLMEIWRRMVSGHGPQFEAGKFCWTPDRGSAEGFMRVVFEGRNLHEINHEIRDYVGSLDGNEHHGHHHRRTLNAGIAFIHVEKENRPMQQLPAHKSLNTNKAILLIQPLDADGNPVDIATLGLPVSSDPTQSDSALYTPDGATAPVGFQLSTPLDAGSVHYTFNPPGFDGLEFDFSYAPPAVGHLNPTFGDDLPDS